MSRFFYAAQSEYSLQALQFAFDIDETGSTRNIRLVEPLAYTRHATMREAILVSAEAIAQWRYDAEGEARYATGCATQMNFIYEDTPEPS
ncbi:MAG: hypothetical protein ACQRW7_02555 [Caulobacterales bacterium]|uniref:hypothetical protein n=1 Tax=Glycocaulis sp. TaxID=1969725 RepID=UPI003FA133E3